MTERTPRSVQTRERKQRKVEWKPAGLLPTPEPRDGWVYRYVRASMLGNPDNVNMSSKIREGWEPVPVSEVPELEGMSDHNSRFPDKIEIGGLILCRAPAELLADRERKLRKQTEGQMEAVDRNYMSRSDPRMPVLTPERRTRVSNFGTD